RDRRRDPRARPRPRLVRLAAPRQARRAHRPAADAPGRGAAPDRAHTHQEEQGMTDSTRFERGMKIRREVLGSSHADATMAAVEDFTGPLQQLVTEYCWGTVWAREELPRRTRSLINLSMIAALNRPHELKLHVRGALRNGVSREEIR